MDFNLNYPSCNFEIKKPENLSQMIEISKVLSKGLPFAKIDLYQY